MGRPVNKHFFGANGIECYAKIGTAAAAKGFIVKQTATHEFIVNVAGTLATVNLIAVDKAALVAGQMMIYVKLPDNTLTFAKTIKGHKLTTATGTQVVWATRTANPAPAAISMISAEVAPAAPTPVVTITTQPASVEIANGATATLTVVANATQGATLTYQWMAEDAGSSSFGPISGATSASYTTAALAHADSGKKYHVVVSAGAATPVTSADATVTVDA